MSRQPNVIAWNAAFADLCRKMSANEQISSSGPHQQGAIQWAGGRKCPKCRATGIYSGIGLRYKLYQDMDAYFCPACGEVTEVRKTYPFAIDVPESFLPVMHQRIAQHPVFLAETHEFGPCPECHEQTRTLRLSSPDSFDKKSHMFFTCTTLGCSYGEHISE